MKTFAPYNWPQDELQIPSGMGGLPQVEAGNTLVIRREGKTFTGGMDFAAGATPRAVETIIIPTDQDGDFWCSNIYLAAFYTRNDGVVSPYSPYGRVRIYDNRTGNPLIYGAGVPMGFLIVNVDSLATVEPPPPAGLRSTSTLIQPFCFTRNGGIKLEIEGLVMPAVNWALSFQIAFGGWQEYTHASR